MTQMLDRCPSCGGELAGHMETHCPQTLEGKRPCGWVRHNCGKKERAVVDPRDGPVLRRGGAVVSDLLHQCNRNTMDNRVCQCGTWHSYCGICDQRQESCTWAEGHVSSEDYAFLLANVRDAVGDDE